MPPLLTIPHLDRAVKTPRDNQRITFPTESASVDAAGVAGPSAQGLRRGYVPEEYGLVAAYAHEAVVVGCDGEVEDLVAVGCVRLD